MDEKDVGQVVEGQGADQGEVDNSKRNIMAALMGTLGVAALAGCAEGGSGQETTAALREAYAGTNNPNFEWVTWIGTEASQDPNNPNLRNLFGSEGQVVVAGGFWEPGDGGGGVFVWITANPLPTPDGGTIIVTAYPYGYWKRIYSGPLSVKWFGARGNGTTEDADAIQRAIDAVTNNVASATKGSGVVVFPKGLYLVSSALLAHAAVTLMGEASPAGGITNAASCSSTILGNYCAGDGALITFDGSNPLGDNVVSGGGVERLRIVQIAAETSGPQHAGTAILVKATPGANGRPSWIKLRNLIIEESGQLPWNWAIVIDGSNCTPPAGIPDVYIGEVSSHTSCSTGGALWLNAAAGPLIYNSAFYQGTVGGLQGKILITATTGVMTAGCQLVNVTASSLTIGDGAPGAGVWDTTVIGGIYSAITVNCDAKGEMLILPARLAGPFVDLTVYGQGAAGLLRFDKSPIGQLVGSLRTSRPPALTNGQYLFGLGSNNTTSRALVGLDTNNAVRIAPYGDALVAIGTIPGNWGSAASPDLIIGTDNNDGNYRHGSVRMMNHALTASHRVISTDTQDNLELGADSAGVKMGTATGGLGFFGHSPVTKPTVSANVQSVIDALVALGLVNQT